MFVKFTRKKTITPFYEGSNSYLVNAIRIGSNLIDRSKRIAIKWEVISISKNSIYAVDTDGFGSSFYFSELNDSWSLINSNDKQR